MSILAPYGQNLVTNGLQNECDLDEIEEVLPPSQSNGPLPHMLQSQETLGMQDLEDTAAEDQWHNNSCEGQSTFSNMVQIGSITMNKSHAIAQHF